MTTRCALCEHPQHTGTCGQACGSMNLPCECGMPSVSAVEWCPACRHSPHDGVCGVTVYGQPRCLCTAGAPSRRPPAPSDLAVMVAGRKDDAGKPRWDLLPFEALAVVVAVLTFGARKYAPDNWRSVEGWRWRYFRAALSHLAAWWRGEKLDPESGLPHLAHAACCVLFLLALDSPVIREE